MKIRWSRWAMLVALLAALVGASSTRSEAKPSRRWPLYSTDTGFATKNPVRAVQYLLRVRGYDVRIDGDFGPQTTRAIRSLQRRHGLVENGELSDPTWEALVVTVRPGSRGNAVRAVQTLLRDVGYNVVVDGVFGTSTRNAVRKFQRAKGRTVDGNVGAYTWCSLFEGNVSVDDE